MQPLFVLFVIFNVSETGFTKIWTLPPFRCLFQLSIPIFSAAESLILCANAMHYCDSIFLTLIISGVPNHRRRHQLDGPDKLQSQGRLQQQMVPVQDSYMQNRAEALQNVESTIVELSNIFSQLATMVAQQGEIAIRYIIVILLVLVKVK